MEVSLVLAQIVARLGMTVGVIEARLARRPTDDDVLPNNVVSEAGDKS